MSSPSPLSPGAAALLALLLLPAFSPARAAAPAKAPPVKLAPFVVKSDPVNSYAFDLLVNIDKATRKIMRLTITGVQADSDAARAGLQPGDQIVKINGQDVTSLSPQTGPDSELNRLLLNRPPGESLRLEVLTKRTLSVTLHAAEPAPGP